MNIINDIITIISKYVGFCVKCKKKIRNMFAVFKRTMFL